MKILIVDRDVTTVNELRSRLVPLGHTIETAENTDNLDKILSTGWDVIFYDPSPLKDIRQTILLIRRANRRSVFMVLLTDHLSFADAISAGFNDRLQKPVNLDLMLDRVDNASGLAAIQKYLANDKEDFPSAGGVIAKSAFNQLFLSCMDRADRYGETSHVIFICIDNYAQITSEAGAYDANVVSVKLASHLVKLRRQSDIIAQTRDNEYALLLLRPMTESEPVEAAHRFAEALAKCTDIPFDQRLSVNIRVTLMRLPTGETGGEHRMAIYQDAL